MLSETFAYKTQNDRDQAIRNYMMNYSPLAYNTTYRTWVEKGIYYVEFTRARSAD